MIKNFLLKNRVKITLSLLTMLFIPGGISFGEEKLTDEEINALREMLKYTKNTKKNDQDAIVIGENAEARKKEETPNFSKAIDSNDSIAIGKDSSTAGKGSIAIGKNAMTGQKAPSGAGSNTDEPADGAVSIGDGAHSLTEGSITLGRNTEAGLKRFDQKEFKGIAIGDGAKAIGGDKEYDEKNDDAGIAIGRNSKANGNYSITIGTEAETKNGGNILIGGKAKTINLTDGFTDKFHPFGSIGIGTESIVKGYNSIALGTEASVGRGQELMENNGNKERDQFNGVSIGYKSNTERPASVSLGAYSNAYRQNMKKEDEEKKYGHRKEVVAPYSNERLEFRSFVDNYYGPRRQKPKEKDFEKGTIVSGVVSVGGKYINNGKEKPFLRQIINLADGTEDTDAVNLRQLKGLEKQMKMGINFYTGGTYNNNIYTPSTEKTDKWSTNRMIFGKGLKAELVKDSNNNEYTNITVDLENNDDLKGKTGEKGEKGDQGLSAYDVWQTLPGNEGKTKEEFFESLKGKDGESGSGLFEYRLKTEKEDISLVEAKDGNLYTKDFLDKNEYKNNEWFKKGTQIKSDLSNNKHKKSDKDVFISSKEGNKTIGNVKAGVYDNDVVNVSQLKEVKTNVKNITNEVRDIRNKVDKIDKKSSLALGGVSNAIAMANLPQVSENKKFSLATSYGYYGGTHAFAVGFSGINSKKNFMYKLSGSFNSKGNIAFGVGAGVMFGDNNSEHSKTSKKVEELERELKEYKDKVNRLEKLLIQ